MAIVNGTPILMAFEDAKQLPGLPLRIPMESGAAPAGSNVDSAGSVGDVDISRLWTLSYIKHNAIRYTILYFPDSPDLGEVVERAKKYCKIKSYNFSWIEPSVVVLDRT